MSWETPIEEALKIEQETLQDIETDGRRQVEYYLTVKAIGGFDIEDASLSRHGNTVEVCITVAQ